MNDFDMNHDVINPEEASSLIIPDQHSSLQTALDTEAIIREWLTDLMDTLECVLKDSDLDVIVRLLGSSVKEDVLQAFRLSLRRLIVSHDDKVGTDVNCDYTYLEQLQPENYMKAQLLVDRPIGEEEPVQDNHQLIVQPEQSLIEDNDIGTYKVSSHVVTKTRGVKKKHLNDSQHDLSSFEGSTDVSLSLDAVDEAHCLRGSNPYDEVLSAVSNVERSLISKKRRRRRMLVVRKISRQRCEKDEDIEGPLQCETCGKQFAKNVHLRRHWRVHTGEKPYQCTVCNKCFSDYTNWKSHSRLHTGEKPFQCDECGKRFVRNQLLQRHKLTHTGQKLYRCDICHKAFTADWSVKEHKRSHTGEKPFLCHICNKSFGRGHHLNRHLAMHRGEKPYQCEICGFCCSQKGDLKRHRLRHHAHDLASKSVPSSFEKDDSAATASYNSKEDSVHEPSAALGVFRPISTMLHTPFIPTSLPLRHEVECGDFVVGR